MEVYTTIVNPALRPNNTKNKKKNITKQLKEDALNNTTPQNTN